MIAPATTEQRRVAAALLLICLIALPVARAHAEDSPEAYTIRRDRVTVGAMSVLASWSAVNLVAGTALWLSADDPEQAAFHQMNAGWNVVNAALAVPSLIGARSRLANAGVEPVTLSQALREQNRLEDTLLFNAGIDFGYMAAGLYLTERARRGGPDAPNLAGFGRSLIVQGAFLAGFDIVVYVLQRRVGRGLLSLADW
jgi:hypothetical protein